MPSNTKQYQAMPSSSMQFYAFNPLLHHNFAAFGTDTRQPAAAFSSTVQLKTRGMWHVCWPISNFANNVCIREYIAGEPAAHYQHRQAHHNQAELPRLNRKGSTRVTEKRADSAAEDKILQTFI